MTTSDSRKAVRGEVYVAIAGLVVVVLLAVFRQPAGPVIAPVIIQGQGHHVQQRVPELDGAPLVLSSHAPGEACREAGVFRPVGELRRGRKAVRPRGFTIGEVFPALPGYLDGAVWMRE